MNWVSVKDRLPETAGYYHWEGKGNTGGYVHFTPEHGFEFDEDIPVNKIDREYLCWLDEKEASSLHHRAHLFVHIAV